MKRYDLMQDINCRGTFLLSRASIPHLADGGEPAHPHALAADRSRPEVGRLASRLHDRQVRDEHGHARARTGAAPEGDRRQLAVAAHDHRHGGGAQPAGRGGRDRTVAHPRDRRRRRPRDRDAAEQRCSGNFFIDDEVLTEEGVTDLSRYTVGDVPRKSSFRTSSCEVAAERRLRGRPGRAAPRRAARPADGGRTRRDGHRGVVGDDGARGLPARQAHAALLLRELRGLDALAVAVFDKVVGDATAKVLAAVAEAGDDPHDQARAAIATFISELTDDPRRARVAFVEALGSEPMARRRSRRCARSPA